MNEAVFITVAAPEDAAAFSHLTRASKAHWGYPAEWLEKWQRELAVEPAYIESTYTVKVTVGGRIAGYCSLMLRGEAGWLDNLFIAPEFMGAGLGPKLFKHALAECRRRGLSRLAWESDPSAAYFYRHMGAGHVGDNPADYGRLLPVFEIDLPPLEAAGQSSS